MKLLNSKDFEKKIYFITEGMDLSMLDEETADFAKESGFEGKAKEKFVDLGPGSSNTILIGLGKEEDVKTNCIRNASFEAGTILNDYRVKKAGLVARPIGDLDEKTVGQCAVEGILHSQYSFDRYKKEPCKKYLEEFLIDSEACDEAAIDEAANITAGNHIARDLVNIPSIDLYPETLADFAKENLSPLGVEVEVWEKDKIKEAGMEAFLAVAEGSDKDPRFIIMKYLPQGEDKEAITLVGKGLTYDSGGYAIKPPKGMVTMKSDMGGSASVIGAVYSIAKEGLNKNVIGIVASCENMISGRAYKNGDIVGSMKGTTIEVGNTDAEGRLTLADALYYAATEVNSECIIDMATLTGACIVALGDKVIGGMTNDQELLDDVREIGDLTGEIIWQLPLLDIYRDMVKGDIGGIKNSVSGGAGAQTAGVFLEHFVENKPWVHLDIAGPSWADSPYGYMRAGGTGVPVKTLYNFVKTRA